MSALLRDSIRSFSFCFRQTRDTPSIIEIVLNASGTGALLFGKKAAALWRHTRVTIRVEIIAILFNIRSANSRHASERARACNHVRGNNIICKWYSRTRQGIDMCSRLRERIAENLSNQVFPIMRPPSLLDRIALKVKTRRDQRRHTWECSMQEISEIKISSTRLEHRKD